MTVLVNVCNFADDATFQAYNSNLEDLVNRLATEWFESNFMRLNEDKCHLIISGHMSEEIWTKNGQTKRWESKKQVQFIVTIDRHINVICECQLGVIGDHQLGVTGDLQLGVIGDRQLGVIGDCQLGVLGDRQLGVLGDRQ